VLAIPLLIVTGFVFVASQSAFVVLVRSFSPTAWARVGRDARPRRLARRRVLAGDGAIADAHGVAATILTPRALDRRRADRVHLARRAPRDRRARGDARTSA